MRKHLARTAFLCLFATTPALAQTTNTATGTGVSESSSQSGAVAIAGGGRGGNSSLTINNPAETRATVNQTISGTTTSNINSHLSGSQTVRNVPSMVAPGLAAAGLETCLGSASGTVSAVGFGIGGGSTYKDEDCTARLDSRTLFSMGLKSAAVARLCQRPDVWRSMPDICQRYWPVGVPLPYGIVVAAPSNARAEIIMSPDGGAVRVVDGRDGVEKDCLNYSHTRQKCYHWAGEQPRRQKSVAALHPARKPMPTMAKPKTAAMGPVQTAAPKTPTPPVTVPSQSLETEKKS